MNTLLYSSRLSPGRAEGLLLIVLLFLPRPVDVAA